MASLCRKVCRNGNLIRILYGISSRRFSSSLSEDLTAGDEISYYPPLKPRYPPGAWGNIAEHSAWRVHGLKNDLLAVRTAKERLESLAGQKTRVLWLVEAMDKRPNNLDFKQNLMKTHIVNGLPKQIYDAVNVDDSYGKLKSILPDLMLQEYDHLYKNKLEMDMNGVVWVDESKYIAQRFLGSVLRTMLSCLSLSSNDLLRCHLDENVRVESFWHVAGFSGKENSAKGKRLGFMSKDGVDLGVLLFQYKHIADWQIRTEMALPEFVSRDDAICREGFVPTTDNGPATAGLKHTFSRPINVSGHWIGDPCEFALVSIHTVPTAPFKNLLEVGDKYSDMAEMIYGLTTAFGSCVSQAHNQGFSDLLNVTHPFTTQCIVSNGRFLRFFSYQLNNIQVWNDANTLRNILWSSDAMPMFEAVENGQIKGLNDETFKTILKFLTLKTKDRGVDLRPYLPEEESPLNKSLYINFKGQEPLPVTKIGRWQYPRNSVYFQ